MLHGTAQNLRVRFAGKHLLLRKVFSSAATARDSPDNQQRRRSCYRALRKSSRRWSGKSFHPWWSRAKSQRREFPRQSRRLRVRRQAPHTGFPACKSRTSCRLLSCRPHSVRLPSPVPPSRWAVTNTTREACRRSVSEIRAEAAAPSAAVTPGITSNSMPARRKASISSPARPNSNGSPFLRRATILSSRARLTIQFINFSLRNSLHAAALSHIHDPRRWRKHTQDFVRHQIIVQHQVRGLQHAPRFARQQLRVTGTSSHEIDFSGHRYLVSGSRLAYWCSRRLRCSGGIGMLFNSSRVRPSCATQPSHSGPNCCSSSLRRR